MKRGKSVVATPQAHLCGPGSLRVQNGRLCFHPLDGTILGLDLSALNLLFLYGRISLSDEAVRELLGHGVEVAFLSRDGTRCRGRLSLDDASSSQLRAAQYRALGSQSGRLRIAREIVVAKLESQYDAARHFQRQGFTAGGPVCTQLKDFLGLSRVATDLNRLRGLEGAATASWYDMMRHLLPPPWEFQQRTRRPPRDAVNSLLSLGSMWVLRRVEAQIRARGLELAFGGLHADRAGRSSLACDVMEPLRVPAIDRWVVIACRKNRVFPGHFERRPDGGVYLKTGMLPQLLVDFEQHWQGSEMTLRLQCILNQLIQLLRCLGASDSALNDD